MAERELLMDTTRLENNCEDDNIHCNTDHQSYWPESTDSKASGVNSTRGKKRLSQSIKEMELSATDLDESEIQKLRLKINSRERRRMHDLNSALDGLREVMPYAHGPSVRKMSKIATLLLARNYITMLQTSLQEMKGLVSDVYKTKAACDEVRGSKPRYPEPALPLPACYPPGLYPLGAALPIGANIQRLERLSPPMSARSLSPASSTTDKRSPCPVAVDSNDDRKIPSSSSSDSTNSKTRDNLTDSRQMLAQFNSAEQALTGPPSLPGYNFMMSMRPSLPGVGLPIVSPRLWRTMPCP